MTDTYKGESLQKKQARYVTHVAAKAWQESLYPGNWQKGLHVFLASREGGDIGALHSTGVPYDNMVGADRCEEALRLCHEKWSAIIGEQNEDMGPHLVLCDDATVEVGWLGHCLGRVKGSESANVCKEGDDCWVARWAKRSGHPWVASVFLDFCAHLDKDTIEAIAYTWSSISIGSAMSVAVLKGREKKQAIKRAFTAPHSNRRMRRAELSRTGNQALALVGRMFRGEVRWDVPAALEAINGQCGSRHPAGARWLLLNYVLTMSCRESYPDPILVLEYQSSTKASSGVPMLIMGFGKRRLGQSVVESPIFTKLSDATATDWRSRIITDTSLEEASLILNAPQSSVAAWKAHATRGTYRKEVA